MGQAFSGPVMAVEGRLAVIIYRLFQILGNLLSPFIQLSQFVIGVFIFLLFCRFQIKLCRFSLIFSQPYPF